jgi:hypothetical protein
MRPLRSLFDFQPHPILHHLFLASYLLALYLRPCIQPWIVWIPLLPPTISPMIPIHSPLFGTIAGAPGARTGHSVSTFNYQVQPSCNCSYSYGVNKFCIGLQLVEIAYMEYLELSVCNCRPQLTRNLVRTL